MQETFGDTYPSRQHRVRCNSSGTSALIEAVTCPCGFVVVTNRLPSPAETTLVGSDEIDRPGDLSCYTS